MTLGEPRLNFGVTDLFSAANGAATLLNALCALWVLRDFLYSSFCLSDLSQRELPFGVSTESESMLDSSVLATFKGDLERFAAEPVLIARFGAAFET